MDKGSSDKIKFGDILQKSNNAFPKQYEQGVNTYFDFLNQFLGGEQGARNQYDPQRIAEQQSLQAQFGPTQYAQMLSALQSLDPTGYAAREKLGTTLMNNLGSGTPYDSLVNSLTSKYNSGTTPYDSLVSQNSDLVKQLQSDFSQGTKLTPDQESELEQEIRRSQASRGNVYGQAPVEAEAFTKGQRGLDLYNQRLQNLEGGLSGYGGALGQQAGYGQQQYVDLLSALGQQQGVKQQDISNLANFQNSATPEQWLQGISPVSADRSMAYVNPNAGYLGINSSNSSIQNLLGLAGLNQQGQGSSPWGSATNWASLLGLIGAFA